MKKSTEFWLIGVVDLLLANHILATNDIWWFWFGAVLVIIGCVYVLMSLWMLVRGK